MIADRPMAFKRLRKDQEAAAEESPTPGAGTEELMTWLSEVLADRFERIGGLRVVVAPVDWPGLANRDGSLPVHPRCAECADSPGCREGWQGHLAELHRRPEVHWHTCEQRNLCAVVPVVVKGRCVAACKLVCPGTTDQEEFERAVELLDILVENTMIREAETLSRLVPGREVLSGDESASDGTASSRPSHPQVIRVMDYVDQHFAEPTLTVAGIARKFGMNAAYLAHLFSQQTGTRMSRYISSRRIELAKKLLTTTNWQIKQVAFESGHTNADWFSQVFHTHVGVTPREFRRQSRVQ